MRPGLSGCPGRRRQRRPLLRALGRTGVRGVHHGNVHRAANPFGSLSRNVTVHSTAPGVSSLSRIGIYRARRSQALGRRAWFLARLSQERRGVRAGGPGGLGENPGWPEDRGPGGPPGAVALGDEAGQRDGEAGVGSRAGRSRRGAGMWEALRSRT